MNLTESDFKKFYKVMCSEKPIPKEERLKRLREILKGKRKGK